MLLLVPPVGALHIRLCMTVLHQYEKHTLLHHIMFHKLVGVDSFHVYLDDRPRRVVDPQAQDRFAELLFLVPGVRVFRFSETNYSTSGQETAGLETQRHALKHCMRFTNGEIALGRQVDWITHFDGDEYLALGPPFSSRPSMKRAVDLNLKDFLRRIPAKTPAFIMPRLQIQNGPEMTGQLVMQPPTQQLGPLFFEPRAYTTMKTPGFHMCLGKWFVRGTVTDVVPHSVHVPGLDGMNAPCSNLRRTPYCNRVELAEGEKFEQSFDRPLWLNNYTSLHLLHYEARSLKECEEKAGNHRLGISATRRPNSTVPSHRGRDTSRACSTEGWDTKMRTYQLWQYGDAVDRAVRDLLASTGYSMNYASQPPQ